MTIGHAFKATAVASRDSFLIQVLPPRSVLISGFTLEVSSNCVFQRRPTHWSCALKGLTLLYLRNYFTGEGLSHSLGKTVTSPLPSPPPDPQAKAGESSQPSVTNPVLIISKNCPASPDRDLGLFVLFKNYFQGPEQWAALCSSSLFLSHHITLLILLAPRGRCHSFEVFAVNARSQVLTSNTPGGGRSGGYTNIPMHLCSSDNKLGPVIPESWVKVSWPLSLVFTEAKSICLVCV